MTTENNSFLNVLTNSTTTQNGAFSYKSSLNACVDLFSLGVSSTSKETLILKALNENPLIALKVIFYLRDARGGQGNRDIFRAFFNVANKQKYFKGLLQYVPEIGRWKDLFEIMSLTTDFDTEIVRLFTQARIDNKNFGLACKFAPRKGNVAVRLTKLLGVTPKKYRQLLVANTQVVETQMCSKEWSEINYSSVPSVANKKYKKAFYRNDSDRYSSFLTKVISGEKKMNSSLLYPGEIADIIFKALNYGDQPNYDDLSSEKQSALQTANALWSQLPNYLESTLVYNVLPVIDTSGSMFSGNGNIVPISLAAGLGIYFSEHNKGSYKDVWCNFSTRPSFYKLEGTTLYEKIKNLDYGNWDGTTNLQAVFDKILDTYEKTKSKEELPKVILIVSDMEFNSADRYSNFEAIKEKYSNLGLEQPLIVFWRVDVKGDNQPAIFDDKKVVLINGYSPSVATSLLSGDIENYTPLNFMLQLLEDKYKYLESIEF